MKARYMKTRYMKTKLLILLILQMTTTACGPATDANPLDSAWSMFESGDYAGAKEEFISAIAVDENARIGLAWSAIRLRDNGYADSVLSLTNLEEDDALAAYVLTSWALGQDQIAIDRAGMLLLRNSAYVFSHDATMNSDDLIWVQAASYWSLGNYVQALERVKQLDASFNSTDPSELLIKIESLGAAR